MLLRKYSKDNKEILYELKGVMPCSFFIFSFVDDYSLYRLETVSTSFSCLLKLKGVMFCSFLSLSLSLSQSVANLQLVLQNVFYLCMSRELE